jgi:uncharacterized protein YjbJ (UPF0337 family)
MGMLESSGRYACDYCANFTTQSGLVFILHAWHPLQNVLNVFHVILDKRVMAEKTGVARAVHHSPARLFAPPGDLTRQTITLNRRPAMNTQTLKGNWHIAKGKLKQKYANLTDNDLRYVEGKEEELVGRIQKITGARREEIEHLLAEIEDVDRGNNL